MDKAAKLRIRALVLGFLCVIACIPIVMATHWIMGLVAYFFIYHSAKAFCRKVLKIELPDEAFLDSSTLVVKKMTTKQQAQADKAKKIVKRISLIMAAIPFAIIFGINLKFFIQTGIWSNDGQWEAMIPLSLVLFISSCIVGTLVAQKLLGIKFLQNLNKGAKQPPRFSNLINPSNHSGFYTRSSSINLNKNDYISTRSDSRMSTTDFMHPSNPFGIQGELSPFNSHRVDYNSGD